MTRNYRDTFSAYFDSYVNLFVDPDIRREVNIDKVLFQQTLIFEHELFLILPERFDANQRLIKEWFVVLWAIKSDWHEGNGGDKGLIDDNGEFHAQVEVLKDGLVSLEVAVERLLLLFAGLAFLLDMQHCSKKLK